jgi:hypothetical protein
MGCCEAESSGAVTYYEHEFTGQANAADGIAMLTPKLQDLYKYVELCGRWVSDV